MEQLNKIICALFDLICYPLADFSAGYGLLVLSILAGIIILLVFRLTSNQSRQRQVKDKIKAHLLEIRLFKDDLGLVFEAQKSILKYNLKYLRASMLPMLCLILPMALILIQLSMRYDRRPLQIGETAIVKLKFKDAVALRENVALEGSANIAVETPPLRIAEASEINWRIKAIRQGRQDMAIRLNSDNIAKSVAVGAGSTGVSVRRVAADVLQQLLYPLENSLPSDSQIQYIEITYPSISYSIFDRPVHWMIIFFVVSLGTGFLLKRIFKWEI